MSALPVAANRELGALALTSPVLLLPCLVPVPVLFGATRWYLRRAHAGYLREAASYSRLTDGLAETVEGARTVEALRLTARRMDRVSEDIAASYAAERYTLRLRNVFLPFCDFSYALPVAAMIMIGGTLYLHKVVSLAAVTAATLYASQLASPVDQILYWLNELQSAGAGLARLLGLARFRGPVAAPSVPASAALAEAPSDGDGTVTAPRPDVGLGRAAGPGQRDRHRRPGAGPGEGAAARAGPAHPREPRHPHPGRGNLAAQS